MQPMFFVVDKLLKHTRVTKGKIYASQAVTADVMASLPRRR